MICPVTARNLMHDAQNEIDAVHATMPPATEHTMPNQHLHILTW